MKTYMLRQEPRLIDGETWLPVLPLLHCSQADSKRWHADVEEWDQSD